MKVTNQTIEISAGDSVTLRMPNGVEVTVGADHTGKTPKNLPWLITRNAAGTEERGFHLPNTGKLVEYELL